MNDMHFFNNKTLDFAIEHAKKNSKKYNFDGIYEWIADLEKEKRKRKNPFYSIKQLARRVKFNIKTRKNDK